jgi:hypothetical protein
MPANISRPGRWQHDDGCPGCAEAARKATEALAIATRSAAALVALGRLMADAADDHPGTTWSDPAVARIQARRRRISASGYRLISGGEV